MHPLKRETLYFHPDKLAQRLGRQPTKAEYKAASNRFRELFSAPLTDDLRQKMAQYRAQDELARRQYELARRQQEALKARQNQAAAAAHRAHIETKNHARRLAIRKTLGKTEHGAHKVKAYTPTKYVHKNVQGYMKPARRRAVRGRRGDPMDID